ncbi:hypothetical protein K1719_021680 [Acacia pycnantha]|nr:hypothetical protein K1719_021680 [Acacia pycnantha]
MVDFSNPLCPKFLFEEKERERLMKPFRRTLVVKLMGRQPSYGFMVKKLRQLWERKGKIDVFDLENDFYLVNFQNNEDYMEALTGGPWVVMDAYLNVARWRPDFCPKNAKIDSVVAWVRFPDLPAPLFDKKFLLNLGNAIGKAIRLDIHTAQRARGRFARMCVELDLTKPLVPEFNVEGQALSVVYESLGMLCNKCGLFGHAKEGCSEFHRKKMEVAMEVETTDDTLKNDVTKVVEKDLWQTVQRVRRQNRNTLPTQNHQNGSRFSVLNTETGGEGSSKATFSFQVRAGQDVPSVKAHRNEQYTQYRKKGLNEKKKEVNRAPKIRKESVLGPVHNGGKKEKVRQEMCDAVLDKGEDDRGGTKGVLQGLRKNTVCATESKVDRSNGHEINLSGKENLNPGEDCANLKKSVAISKADMVMMGADEDPVVTIGMSVHEGQVPPNLANDIRGAASKGVAAVLRDMKYRYKLDIVVILEPRVSGTLANRIIKNWGFKHSVKREAEGFSGEIWILWNLDDLIVDVLGVDEQFIHCHLCLNNKKMFFTAVYASP